MLDPHVEAKMIYPVALMGPKVRKNQMIISAGPVGGGGLGVYRALPCSKIYTIFLPMNDSNWTMQYCQKSSAYFRNPGVRPAIHRHSTRNRAGSPGPRLGIQVRFQAIKRASGQGPPIDSS